MQRSMAVDDCAMRPLKVLGEENRRKSAPTALTRPKGLRDEEWRVGDENENNFLGSGYKFASDDDDDESLSLPSADLDSTMAAEAFPHLEALEAGGAVAGTGRVRPAPVRRPRLPRPLHVRSSQVRHP